MFDGWRHIVLLHQVQLFCWKILHYFARALCCAFVGVLCAVLIWSERRFTSPGYFPHRDADNYKINFLTLYPFWYFAWDSFTPVLVGLGVELHKCRNAQKRCTKLTFLWLFSTEDSHWTCIFSSSVFGVRIQVSWALAAKPGGKLV